MIQCTKDFILVEPTMGEPIHHPHHHQTHYHPHYQQQYSDEESTSRLVFHRTRLSDANEQLSMR